MKLTAAEFDAVIDGIPEQFRAAARSTGRKPFAENLVKVLVLAQEGKRLKVDDNPSFKLQEQFQTTNHLASAAFAAITDHVPVDEAEVKAYYEAHKAEFEQVRARHILIRTSGSMAPLKPGQKDLSEQEGLEKIQGLRKQLLAGADFAALAAKESDDAGSAVRGGELDAFGHGQMVVAFDKAAFALKAGELSEPVQTPFGWHLIRVEARQAKPLNELRAEIEQRIRPQVAQKTVEELQSKATVVFDPAFFDDPAK